MKPIELLRTLLNLNWPYEYEIVVNQLHNERGDQTYPLASIELPILLRSSSIEPNAIIYDVELNIYIVLKRIELTNEESYKLIDEAFNLFNQLTLSLSANTSILLESADAITYSGYERSKFSDDVDGVIGTLKFKMSIPKC